MTSNFAPHDICFVLWSNLLLLGICNVELLVIAPHDKFTIYNICCLVVIYARGYVAFILILVISYGQQNSFVNWLWTVEVVKANVLFGSTSFVRSNNHSSYFRKTQSVILGHLLFWLSITYKNKKPFTSISLICEKECNNDMQESMITQILTYTSCSNITKVLLEKEFK